jgi:hypothetical protein
MGPQSIIVHRRKTKLQNFVTYTYLFFIELIMSFVIPDLKGDKSFSITEE